MFRFLGDLLSSKNNIFSQDYIWGRKGYVDVSETSTRILGFAQCVSTYECGLPNKESKCDFVLGVDFLFLSTGEQSCPCSMLSSCPVSDTQTAASSRTPPLSHRTTPLSLSLRPPQNRHDINEEKGKGSKASVQLNAFDEDTSHDLMDL